MDTVNLSKRDLLFRRCILGFLAAAGAAWMSPPAGAETVIGDSSFFNDFPTTLIDFQTYGNGDPVELIPGETKPMPPDEYLSLGVSFLNSAWTNDGNAAFQAALAIGGSPEIAIPPSNLDEFEVIFTANDIRAFGFWVVNNRLEDAAGPLFVAYNSANEVIGMAQFGGSLIDGTITTPNTTADYGFMGLLTTDPIARVVITKEAAIVDDMRFSPVPAPGGLAVAGLAGLMLARRRR